LCDGRTDRTQKHPGETTAAVAAENRQLRRFRLLEKMMCGRTARLPLGLSSRRNETNDPKVRPLSAVRSVTSGAYNDDTEDTMSMEDAR
jgi:hypothetical protein